MKNLMIVMVVLLSLFQTPEVRAFSLDDLGKTFGGEVPWPLSNQKVVTVENTRGLWRLSANGRVKIFNVEMIAHKSGIEWIRVSELDPDTYAVVSWGEGFFRHTSNSAGNSYSNLNLGQSGQGADKLGRYIYMFPSGDIFEHPYYVRLVEVETSLGPVLGLSIIRHLDMEFEHMLGRRLLKKPLICKRVVEPKDELRCFFE